MIILFTSWSGAYSRYPLYSRWTKTSGKSLVFEPREIPLLSGLGKIGNQLLHYNKDLNHFK